VYCGLYCGLWTVNCGLWIVHCALWTVDCVLCTVDCALCTVDCVLCTVDCVLWTMDYAGNVVCYCDASLLEFATIEEKGIILFIMTSRWHSRLNY
jgi:hypothetical protein